MSRTITTHPLLSRAATATLVVGAAALAVVPVLGVASPALAHDQLIGTAVEVDPADGSADAVRLTFSNSIIEVGTEILITSPDGDDATDGDPLVDGPDVTQPLADDLAPGVYSAAWRVVSSDGHPIEGAFALTVPESGEPTIGDEAITEDDPRFADDEAETADATGTDDGHDHDHGDAAAEDSDAAESDAPVGAVIAVVVGGAAVIAGGIAAATAGNRRRARGMAADAERQREAANEDREDRA